MPVVMETTFVGADAARDASGWLASQDLEKIERVVVAISAGCWRPLSGGVRAGDEYYALAISDNRMCCFERPGADICVILLFTKLPKRPNSLCGHGAGRVQAIHVRAAAPDTVLQRAIKYQGNAISAPNRQLSETLNLSRERFYRGCGS
jgi:hypothetical protein